MDSNYREHTALNHKLGIKTVVNSKEHEEIHQSDGINTKLLIVQDDVMTQFWNRGLIETRNWNWILVGLRFPFEIVYMLAPMNESQFWSLVVFSLMSTVMIAMQIASYKVKSTATKEGLIYFVLCLLNVRTSLVFLDFEEVKHHLDDPDQIGRKTHFDWAQDIQAITSLQVVNLIMLFNFSRTRFHKIVILFNLVFI